MRERTCTLILTFCLPLSHILLTAPGAFTQALFLMSLLLTAIMPDLVSSVVTLDIVGAANCSDTANFMKRQLLPVYKKYSNLLKINYHPYGSTSRTSCQQNGNIWQCKCARGPKECEKNYLQACLLDKLTDPYPIDILKCIQFGRTMGTASYICLEEQNQVEPELRKRIRKCARGQEGVQLMMKHGETIKKEISTNVTYVPWISIGGTRVEEAEFYLETVLCQNYFKPKPPECDVNT